MVLDVETMICFFKHKTAYGVLIIVWSSDVCSSNLRLIFRLACDDVGQPGAGVAAEERALWSAQHLYAFHLAEFGESDSGPAAINAVDEGRDRRFKAGIVADRPDPANARHPADRL